MADTMIERVAREMAQLEIGEGETVADGFWRQYIGDARKILSAMREPTESMMVDAIEYEALNSRATSRNVWSAMIDAALAEEG